METKFKTGDLIYCITQIDRGFRWHILSCEPIKSILIDNGVIRYGFIDSLDKMIYLRESDCFLTKQEARAECKKRNIELIKQKNEFMEEMRYLAKMFSRKYITVEFDCCEKENVREIIEQLQYEAKSNKIQIRWKNEI